MLKFVEVLIEFNIEFVMFWLKMLKMLVIIVRWK